jgi:hypothetical protein
MNEILRTLFIEKMNIKTLIFFSLTLILFSCNHNYDKNIIEGTEFTIEKDTIDFAFYWEDIKKKFTVNNIEIGDLPRNKEIELTYNYQKRSGKMLSKLNLDLISNNSNLIITKIDNFHFKLFIKNDYKNEEFKNGKDLTRIEMYYSPKKHQVLYNVYDSLFYEYPEKINVATSCTIIEPKN